MIPPNATAVVRQDGAGCGSLRSQRLTEGASVSRLAHFPPRSWSEATEMLFKRSFAGLYRPDS